MLTKDLLEVEKRKPNIRPVYRDIGEYRSVAQQVIDAYEPGRTRAEIEDEVAEMETHDTFKLVRGLSTLLERRATFEQQAPVAPVTLRQAVFERGFVTTDDERGQVIAEVASEHGLSATEVEDALWADQEDEHVLVSAPEIDPDILLRQYNLSLTQTLLFDATELEFAVSGNYQEIFGLITYLGLMYRVDDDLTVTVTGPAALFRKTRKYGTTLAKLLPSITKADEWSITAQVETEVSDETRIYELSLDSEQDHLFPARAAVESFDSDVERDFATRIDSLVDGWTVRREPTILRTGNRVMIPDFNFERDRGEETAFYLEVIGFWTPEYLEEKLEKVRHVESEHPIMLAVDETLNCTTEDFNDANVEQVFFYTDSIPVKPVLDRLNAIDERYIQCDLQVLMDRDIEPPSEKGIDIEVLAEQYDVEPAAVRRYLDDHAPGAISNGRYVPLAILDSIEAKIDALEDPTLADVAPVLERYGVAQTLLETIGYTVNYTTLNQKEADVEKAPKGLGE